MGRVKPTSAKVRLSTMARFSSRVWRKPALMLHTLPSGQVQSVYSAVLSVSTVLTAAVNWRPRKLL
ncbi:hypothetical protein D3C72_1654030 [compost metagenome]